MSLIQKKTPPPLPRGKGATNQFLPRLEELLRDGEKGEWYSFGEVAAATFYNNRRALPAATKRLVEFRFARDKDRPHRGEVYARLLT